MVEIPTQPEEPFLDVTADEDSDALYTAADEALVSSPAASNLPAFEISQERLDDLTEIFGKEMFSDGLSRSILAELAPQFKQMAVVPPEPAMDVTADEGIEPDFSYKAFTEGTHGLGNIPGYEEFENVPFTPDEIVTSFTNLESGDFTPAKGVEAFIRAFVPSASGMAAGFRLAPYGAKAGAAVGRPILGGGLAFMGGMLVGDYGARKATDLAGFGDTRMFIPGTDSTLKALETAGVFAPYALMPWALPAKVNLGAASAVDAHLARLGKDRFGPTVYAAGTRRRDDGTLETVKAPIRLRLGSLIERALQGTAVRGKSAVEQGVAATREAATVGGASLAVAGFDPDGEFERLGTEMAGAVSAGVLTPLAVKMGPLAYQYAGRVRQRYKELGREAATVRGKAGAFGKSLYGGFKERRQSKAAEIIRGFLEKEGGYTEDDILALSKSLEEAPEAQTLTGVKIDMTAGQVTGDPMLQAIEASIARSMGGLSGQQQKNQDRAKTALMAFLGNMIDSGDDDALRAVGKMAYGIFQDEMARKLTAAWGRYEAAIEKFGPDVSERNLTVLGEKLHDIFVNNLKSARTVENELYKRIDDIDIPKFYDRDADGELVETGLPSVIRFYDENVAQGPIPAIAEETVQKLGVLGKAIENLRSQVGAGPSPAAAPLPSEKRLARLLESTAGEASQKTFSDIITGKSLTGRNLSGNREPLLATGDDGKLLATDENIAALGKIISDRSRSPGKGSNFKKSQQLLQAQKDILVAQKSRGAITSPTAPQPITLQQLVTLRSRALGLARTYAAQEGEENFGRLAGKIAEAARTDIQNYFDMTPQAAERAVIESWTTANSYSRALHDTFSRGLVDDAVSRKRRGDYSIAPETLATRLKQTPDLSSARYLQVKEVDDFFQKEFPDLFEESEYVTTGETLDKILRVLVRNTAKVDNEGKTLLDVKSLTKFMNEYSGPGRPLEYFPKLMEDLGWDKDTKTFTDEGLNFAQRLLDGARKRNTAHRKNYNRQMIFGRFAGAEKTYGSPLQLIDDALSDPNPLRALRSLTQPVLDAPDELKGAAKAGLLSSVLEHVIGTQAGAEGAKVNFTKAYQTLFAPLPGAGKVRGITPKSFGRMGEAIADRSAAAIQGDKVSPGTASRLSVMQFLQREGIVDEPKIARVERLLRELMRYEALDTAGELESALVEGVGPVLDFYLRVSGSMLGTTAQKLMPGGASGPGALVAASAGSKFMQKIFNEMPQVSAVQAMQEMVENPALLAQMLRKPRSEREAFRVGESIKTFLTKAGIILPSRRAAPAAVEAASEEEVDIEDAILNAVPVQSAPPPPARVPGGQSSIQAPQFKPLAQRLTEAAPAPAPRPTGQPNPKQRQGLATLFPNDPILGAGRNVG